jgi:hypothetical protein
LGEATENPYGFNLAKALEIQARLFPSSLHLGKLRPREAGHGWGQEETVD